MYSAGFKSSMPGLGLATRFVIPNPNSPSLTSSSNVSGSGTSCDSASSFQKRFDGPAKWCPVSAERTPGLMPTNSTRSPGPICSVRRRCDQFRSSDWRADFIGADIQGAQRAAPSRSIQMHPGTFAPWHPGTLALWHLGTLALWHPWHFCTLALWHLGTLALWHPWHFGTLALWHPWHFGTVAP